MFCDLYTSIVSVIYFVIAFLATMLIL